MVTAMSGRSLKTRKVFQRSLFALLFLFIAAAIFAHFLVNSEYFKSRISNAVLAETGINLSFSEISISFFPKFHLSLSDIRARIDDKKSGSIDHLMVYPDVYSLLKGRIIVTKAVVQDFEAQKLIEKAAPAKTIYPVAIRGAMDRFAPFIHKDNGIEIVLERIDTRFFSAVNTSVRVRRVKKGIAGKILPEDLKVKGESFKTLFSKNRALLSAGADSADIKFTVDEKGGLSGECRFRSLSLRSFGESDLALNPEDTTISFDISSERLKVRMSAASLAPVLEEPEISFVRMSGTPAALKFSAEKVRIEPAQTYANAFIGKNSISRNIFKVLESGVSPKIEVSFANSKGSKLFDPKNLTIKGKLRSGKVNIPGSGLTAENVSGEAFMKDGTLDLEADRGSVRNNEIHKGTVSLELLSGPGVPFTSQINFTADLQEAPAMLSRLVDNEPFAEEMNRVTVTEGSALVDLFLEKKLKSSLQVEVSARDIRLKGRYERMHDRIEIFDGSLFYKKNTARIDHVTAGSGGSYLYDTSMDVSFEPEPLVNVRSGKALFRVKEIFPYLVSMNALSAESLPFSPESGTVWIDSLNLTLPFKEQGDRDLRIKGEAKDIRTASAAGKKDGCVLAFDFTASGEGISISGLKGRVKDLHPVYERTGSDIVKGIRTPFEIVSGKLEFDPAEIFFTGKLDFSSGPSIELTLRKNRRSGFTLAGFTLEHILIKDPPATRFDFDNTGEKADVEGFMSSSTLEKMFTANFLSSFEFMQLAKEKHFLISSHKESFLKLDAYRIRLEPFLSQQKEYPELGNRLQDKTIRIKTRYLDAGGYTLNKIEALLDFKPDKTVIQLLKADLCGIDIKGTILKKNDFLEYRAKGASKDSDNLRQTVECLFNKKSIMDGSYFFQGFFYSKTPLKQVKETVSGNFELNASNGRIYRLTLLSRVLSVINVSRFLKGSLPDIMQDGFEYHTVSLKADVKDSRIVVNEGIIDGTDMSIIFTGDIYPVEQRVDLTFLVAPFKTVDMIVKNIPVLNTLLGGKLVSIPVKAEGSMANPLVMPLHPSAVGTGLTDMMRNIVNTPVKLMEKLP